MILRLREIPNVIDESLFNPDIPSSGIREELEIKTTHVITFVARLNEFKDPLTLVKSIPFVVEQEPDVTFLIAGDGPLIEEVRSLARDLGIRKYVKVLGNRQDVNRILKISSVFVALSPYENIWSLVIIEAMKMGVPCIVTSAGTTEKYLRHNTDAILIPPRDERTLAREIIRLLHDEALRTSLSEKGRILMESNFSTDSIVNSYDRMISDLFPEDENLLRNLFQGSSILCILQDLMPSYPRCRAGEGGSRGISAMQDNQICSQSASEISRFSWISNISAKDKNCIPSAKIRSESTPRMKRGP